MIGTFYQAPHPEASPFVRVGDHIEKGQKICVIEAMKLFYEVESYISGTIVQILLERRIRPTTILGKSRLRNCIEYGFI